jgi:hypothetical protein
MCRTSEFSNSEIGIVIAFKVSKTQNLPLKLSKPIIRAFLIPDMKEKAPRIAKVYLRFEGFMKIMAKFTIKRIMFINLNTQTIMKILKHLN